MILITGLSTRSFSAKACLILLVIFVLCLEGCAPKKDSLFRPDHLPLFYDDSDRESLKAALQIQLHYINSLPENDVITVGQDSFKVFWLAESLKTFSEIINLEPPPLDLDRIIRENFIVYQARGRSLSKNYEMLVTGYFEPVLEGSLVKKPPFIYPVYSPPPDLVKGQSEKGVKTMGRIDQDGQFLPYWTRGEIENSNKASGSELVYLKDAFDAFLLHVQGSGKIELPDGSHRPIHYATNNGHKYSSIGKYLVDNNKMDLQDVNIPSIRQYLRENPEQQQRILNHNKRYIFFHWGEGQPIKGSLGEALTPGRSIAIDKHSLPMGLVGYLSSQKPLLDDDDIILRWIPLQRFVLPQDSGAAIEGPGRVDLFWGNGKYAEIAAGAMKEKGYLYFLIKNDFEIAKGKSD